MFGGKCLFLQNGINFLSFGHDALFVTACLSQDRLQGVGWESCWWLHESGFSRETEYRYRDV